MPSIQPVKPPTSQQSASPMESLGKAVECLARDLTARAQATREEGVRNRPLRLAIRRIDDHNGRRSRLDLLIEDKLCLHLGKANVEVLPVEDRQDQLLEVAKVTRTGLVTQGHRIEPGQLDGAEAALFGYTHRTGRQLDLTVFIHDVRTGRQLAGGETRIDLDDELDRFYSTRVVTGGERARGKKGEVIEVPKLKLGYSLIGWAKDSSGRYRYIEIRDDGSARMTLGDQFKVVFQTNEDAYVYVLMIGSGGKACRLFPHPDIPQSEQAKRTRRYEVPLGNRWFDLDDRPGTETIYVLGSYEPVPEILGIPPAAGDRSNAGQKPDGPQLEQIVRGLRTRGLSHKYVLRERDVAGISEQQHSWTISSPDRTQLLDAVVRQAGSREGCVVRQISFEHR